MRITSVDVWKVIVPTIPGTVHSPEFGPVGWDQVPKFIIRLNTDEGVTGIGETYRGVSRAAVQACIDRVIGVDPLSISLQYLPLNPLRPNVQYPGRDWEIGGGTGVANPAYDAFEMAFFDLVGKALDVPAHFLLGGAFRKRVKADFWIGQQTPEDAARNARIGKSRGFGGIKMKCAIDDPWIDRLEAIVEAAGPDFRITIDPNERFYRPHEAIALARQLERFPNIEVFEDPVPKWNLDWYRQIRAAIHIPVALHLANPHEIINAIKAEACDCMNLGGGMVQFVRNAAIVEAAGMACWHGSGNDLGILEHAALHAAAAARNCVLASDFVGSWTREDDLIVEPIHFEDGYAIVPERPGLGCELDLDAVKRYQVPESE
jgi:L-alanine-DL-glutamate epimerase-like enolase superfamily enzyme